MRLLLVLLALVLHGCSPTRLAYNNADMLIRWEANSYFDLAGEQSEEFDRMLASFQGWHRKRALPQYAALAEEAAARLARGYKREDIDWGYDAVQAQVRESLGAAAAEAAGLLDRLSPEQLGHFEQRLAEDNRRFAKEHLRGTMEERQERRLQRNVERLEDWFGPLSEVQLERVRRYGARAPLYDELRDRDRKRRQAELLAMLRSREARARLARWAQEWDRGREPAYERAVGATRAEYTNMLLDLNRTLSAEQREHGARRLRRYAALFSELSREQ
ncbi:MAG: hypothetical protein IT513_12615 [Burkholderiales bacterium]|nr:hypothetical protein [Burkholderiales bacterium]